MIDIIEVRKQMESLEIERTRSLRKKKRLMMI